MKCYSCIGEHPDDDGWFDLCAGLQHNPQKELTISQVQAVDKFWTDDSDEPSFLWLLRLKDGRWAAVSGGHDYTGWA